MTILLVQTFLLLLSAFLLGASLACLIRRGLHGGKASDEGSLGMAVAPAAAAGAAGLDTGRFERALVGGEGRAVPPVFHGQPVVEVQPRPAPAPEPAPPPAPPAPAPVAKPQPAPAPAAPPAEIPFTPVSTPRPPEPQPVAREPEPAPPPPVVEAPRPPTEPERPTLIARPPAEPSYAEVAVAAAAAAAAAQAAGAAAQAVASEPSRFGTPTEDVPLPAGGGDDLTRIHSIDGDLKERLNRLGVFTFAEIAAWKASDLMRLSQSLGFAGRIEQENWVGQAQVLTRGGDARGTRSREGAAAVAVVPPVDGERLHRIIGIDPESEALLFANGVKTLADIAGWTDTDVARFEGLIGQPGRIVRENWVEQARFLTRGAAVPAPAAPAAVSEAAAPAQRTDYSGLRSVKSEALLGDALPYVPPTGEVDDLKRIRGIGVLIEKKLNSLGITSYEQVANWTGADVDRISEMLDFKGRIQRENWIEQARILASGGQTEFSRRADRGEA